MQDISQVFPVLDAYTYLNTASCGIISKPLIDWRHEHDKDLMNQASVFRDRHKTHIESIRKSVANFFDASINETALVPNFSFGFNTFLGGLNGNHKILLLKTDYPSINWAVENREFEVCYADINENLEMNIEEAITAHHPTIFAFSLVQYISGIKIDLEFLKRLKAYHPNLLLVADGTQFLGTSDFSFSKSGLDVLGASTYKWMLAGYGNGVFIVKEDIHNKITPKTIGFNSADAIYGKRDEITFIKRFEPGHQDTLNYGSLQLSIKMLQDIGMKVIENKINSISIMAKKRFTELGLLDDSVVRRNQHSSIFNLKGNDALFQKLKENNIICSQRGNGIRVSFHFYNTEEELDKVISIIS